jgi:hypothetical protein
MTENRREAFNERSKMQLSIKSMGIASAILWGAAMMACLIANLVSGTYAGEFLKVMSSIYPGLHASRTVGDVIVGTCYGLVDGGLGGAVFAWLYNRIARQAG